MRYIVCAAIAIICTTLSAQTQPARPQFEVASVRPVASVPSAMSGAVLSQIQQAQLARPPEEIPIAGTDRVHMQGWTLLGLISAAYSVRATQVSGPAWISDARFNIDAKVPEGTPKEDLNAMLQVLLEDRFGLKVHRATQAQKASR